MAFNDMNSWDEDPDEQLRQRWQRTFADFEVQPRSALSRRVLNQLRAGRHRRRAVWLAAGILLLLGVGLLYPLRFRERPDPMHASTILSQRAQPNGPLPTRPKQQPAVLTSPPTQPDQSATALPTRESVNDSRSAVHSPTVPDPETTHRKSVQVTIVPAEKLAGWHGSTERARRRTESGGRPSITSVFVDQPYAISPHSRSTRSSVQSSDLTETVSPALQLAPVVLPVNDNQSAFSPSPASQSVATPEHILWAQLNPTGLLHMRSRLSALPDYIPTLDRVARPLAKSTGAQPGWHWFVEAAPLSSFQRMSAPPVASLHLSQVETPAAFSPATWGYELNGGIRFQRWQAHLAIGQIRRWAYYTVNENQYRIEPGSANAPRLVRESYRVNENAALPMIGAGLIQTHHLGHFDVEVGGKLSYLPSSSQMLIGLRGGVSHGLSLSQRMELQIGLRGEYSLKRLLNEQGQLAIHPLLLGIGFRLQPHFGHPKF
ncbi:hypothetical protein [Spirosoma sp.]|uniref:hypothetical protein n=1 Tax=Spirosoma sp. TaxID=1899569 RepID=UPI002607B4F1|nr:hypothetical protein [Spirosoma sp.]MCX6215620.1 hypothetical protein [Spirosoma sp.]